MNQRENSSVANIRMREHRSMPAQSPLDSTEGLRLFAVRRLFRNDSRAGPGAYVRIHQRRHDEAESHGRNSALGALEPGRLVPGRADRCISGNAGSHPCDRVLVASSDDTRGRNVTCGEAPGRDVIRKGRPACLPTAPTSEITRLIRARATPVIHQCIPERFSPPALRRGA